MSDRLKELMKLPKENLARTVEYLEEENRELKLKPFTMGTPILLVEDGSVDIDRLEEDGFYVIPYRQGSMPPMFLTHQHEDKGE
jgi:hypothetical protein